MVDVLYTYYKIRNTYFILLDVCFDIGKSWVRVLDVLYAHFDIRESYLRTVDIQDTHFSIRKVCVWHACGC